MTNRLWSVYDYQNFLSFPKEVLMLIIYLFLIALLAIRFRKKVRISSLKKFVFPAVTLKMIGSIGVTSIYIFYYKHGDTTAYFNDACLLVDLSFTDFALWREMFFGNFKNFSNEARELSTQFRFTHSKSFLLAKIGSIFSYFTFKSFYATTILFGWFSFIGMWKLLETLVDIFPRAYKEAAYSIFFIPSVFFWGSGFMKEAIIMGAIGYFVKALHFLFIRKKLRYIIPLLVGSYLIASIKVYILLCLFPALLVYLFFSFKNNIQNAMLRFLVTPFIMVIMVILGGVLIQALGSINQQYSVDNIMKTAEITGNYIKFVSDRSGGSSYDLGEIDYSTPIGLVKVLPKAVNVTIFRPYIWEVKNVVMLLSAFESFIFLVLSIWLLFKIGLFKILKHSMNNPFLYFCLVFSISFAFAVGMTSFNFGSLVRYKIPMMPFYCFILLFLFNKKYRIPR